MFEKYFDNNFARNQINSIFEKNGKFRFPKFRILNFRILKF